jgi:predicted alpha/beta-fold hydrolase
LSFPSPWWLPGGHLQTIVASLFPPPRVPLRRERWDTPDGDFIDVDFCGDPGAAKQLVLFHGLEGGSDSHYARSIAGHALERGWRLAIPHFRGCSGEPNRTRRAYHSGDSEEIDWVLKRLGGPLFTMGVSLGGNVLLKWLGERGEEARALVRRAAAVSAPVDFGAAGDALDRGLNRILYVRHFLSTMKPKAFAKLEVFPGLYDRKKVEAVRTASSTTWSRPRCTAFATPTITGAPLRAAPISSTSAFRRSCSTRATIPSSRSASSSRPRERRRPAWC